jgi:hypothetical protein
MPEFIKEKIEESKKDKKADAEEEEEEDKSKKADEDDEEEDEKDEKKDASSKKADEDDEDEKDEKDEKKAKKAGPNEMDIELTGAVDEEVKPDPEADKQLASLFDDGITAVEEEEEEKADEKKAKKAGIKKLGGQPKVASSGGESVDISSIWNSAPDVSSVFK